MAWIWVIKHISKFITQLFAKDFVFPLSYGFVWFHMEQNWALTYSSEMQVVENYVSFFGRYPSRNFEPPFKKTNCGPLHTIKPQTFSICTVLDGILAWVPLTLMKLVKPHLSPKGRLKWQFLDSFTLLWLKLAKLLLLHT